jgi:hypothetical protein
MATRALLAAAVAAITLAPAAHSQNLAGSQVTVAGYCCTAPPGPGTQATNAVTATVGPNTEFPAGSLTSLTSGLSSVPVAIDVGSNDIELNYSQASGLIPAGGFNGYIFTFANAPTITGVSLDSRSSSEYTPGLNLTATTMGLLSVTTAGTPTPPVPEPETYAMLLAGLGLLGWTAKRRRG